MSRLNYLIQTFLNLQHWLASHDISQDGMEVVIRLKYPEARNADLALWRDAKPEYTTLEENGIKIAGIKVRIEEIK